MDETESLTADRFSRRVPHRRGNMQMVQNVLLIWLDNKIDTNDPDYRNAITRLRCVINSINIFTDHDQCVNFLRDISNENICMIISSALCENIVPLIHDIAQLHTIFIFCGSKAEHEQWVSAWSKIKGVFTEISSICEALKQVAQQCEQNAISMSFIGTGDDIAEKKLDELEPSFMYTQILKEIFLKIKFQQQHITEFIDYLREQFFENDHKLKTIKEFEEKYHDITPIQWYARECFLYSMLNCALRMMDTDVVIKMGFFISDLHRHIEELHLEQFDDDSSRRCFQVYRGQGMAPDNFEKMKKTKGGLISFNNFLSTSQNHNAALAFAESNQSNPELVGILFVMVIDPSKSTTPFAFIKHISNYQDEDEVLFAMNSVFRIGNIKSMSENNRLFYVDLTLTNDNDKDLHMLTHRIREDIFSKGEGWEQLASLLRTIGRPDKAQEVYETLLNQTTNESQRAFLYNQLGWAKRQQGKYLEAITLLRKSLEGYEKTWPTNHPDVAWPYHNIGMTYNNMGEYERALSFHEKALAIRKQSLSPNHPDLAASYSNVGITYNNMRKYQRALSYFEKTLEIRQQILPSNHPTLAACYNNIGLVYKKMGEYRQALLYYEKALEIRQKSLPPIHSDLGDSYSNIGVVYRHMDEYSKALSFHEKALEIRQKLLPTHPSLAMSYDNIGIVYDKMGEYSKAYSFYERAVQIGEQSLPTYHHNLRQWRKNFENVKKKL
jgi:tetratricopeptide (TPR) repeat protein